MFKNICSKRNKILKFPLRPLPITPLHHCFRYNYINEPDTINVRAYECKMVKLGQILVIMKGILIVRQILKTGNEY
jgi:hypothetical protein